MNPDAYAVLVYAARYWFVALAAVIAVRAFVVSRREYRLAARLRSEIGSAGALAKLVLISDPQGKYEPGMEYPLGMESLVGRARGSDVCLRNRSIQPRHARLDVTSDGLRVRVRKNAFVAIDGVAVEGEGYAADGEQIQMGDLLFKLTIGGERD